MELLHDHNSAVRCSAAIALGKLDRESSKVAQVLNDMGRDGDSRTQMSVIIALALLGEADEGTIPALIEATGGEEKSTAEAAAIALKRLVRKQPERLLPDLMDALKEAEGKQAERIVRVLRSMGPLASEALPLMQTLYEKLDTTGRKTLLSAVTAMDKKGEKALPILKMGLGDPDPQVRRESLIGFLKYRGRPELFLNEMAESLEKEEPKNRILILGILRGLRDKAKAALPAVIACCKNSDPSVRIAALNTLSVISEASAGILAACGESLSDQHVKVRCAAVKALTELGKNQRTSVMELLEKALSREQHEKTRRCIESALSRLARS